MDLRIIVMILLYPFLTNSDKSNSLEIPGCKYFGFVDEYSVYKCPNSYVENFSIKYKWKELLIKCKRGYRLESLPGKHLSIFNTTKKVMINGCKLDLPELDSKSNNLKLPMKVRSIDFFLVRLFRLPKYLFSGKNELEDVRIMGKRDNITLPGGLFSNLPRLTNISITCFKLTFIPNNTFSNSTKIETINLSHNQLVTLPDGLFDGLTNLKMLDIQCNYIYTLSSNLFRDLRELLVLNLFHNRISYIGSNQFHGLISLKRLYLESNQIEVIEPTSMQPFADTLEFAYFHSNKISFSELQSNNQPSPFANCTKLKSLLLQNNKISKFFRDWTSLESLVILKLDNNEISKLTDLDLSFISKKIHVINLSSNKIRLIEFNANRLWSRSWNITTFEKFAHVIITNNPLVCDCNLYNVKQYIETNDGPLRFEIRAACQEPNNMKGIRIADAKSENLICENVNTTTVTVCPYPCSCKFWPYKNADLVDCSNRNLTEAPYQLFPSRNNVSIHLNLTGNRLTNLPRKHQPNYNFVEELYVSHNQIEVVRAENIISNLKVLALDNNKLKNIQDSEIDAIQKSFNMSLRLNNNSWICDCEHKKMYYFLKENIKANVPDDICVINNVYFWELKFLDVCLDSKRIISSVLFTAVTIICAVITILCYRNHIEIKIWMKTHMFCPNSRPEKELREDTSLTRQKTSWIKNSSEKLSRTSSISNQADDK